MIAVFFLLVLLTSIFSGCVRKDSDEGDNNIEEPSMDFMFTLLNGSTKNISEYLGRVVLIDFMGANCQPCQLQMLVLNALSDTYEDEIEIISIDVWIVLGETVNTMNQFIQLFADEGYDLDWVFGVDDASGTLYYEYGDRGVPMLYLLDENGKIYYSKAGYTEYLVLAEEIDELLD